MAIPYNLKNDFDPNRTNATQMQLAVWFEQQLLKLAKMAGNALGQLDVDAAGAFGVKLEQRFGQVGSHRFYRASAGSTIERLVYTYLLSATGAAKGLDLVTIGELPDKVAGVYNGQLNATNGVVNLTFALEYTSKATGLPCSFSSSRPDIRLSLGAGPDGSYSEAIFDLTSEAQKDHVLKKGDNWMSKAAVPYITEILWTNDDIMLK